MVPVRDSPLTIWIFQQTSKHSQHPNLQQTSHFAFLVSGRLFQWKAAPPKCLRQRFQVLLIPKKQSPETLDWLVYWFVKTLTPPCQRRRDNCAAFNRQTEKRKKMLSIGLPASLSSLRFCWFIPAQIFKVSWTWIINLYLTQLWPRLQSLQVVRKREFQEVHPVATNKDGLLLPEHQLLLVHLHTIRGTYLSLISSLS